MNLANKINATSITAEMLIRVNEEVSRRAAARDPDEKPDMLNAFFAAKDALGDVGSDVKGKKYLLVNEALFRAVAVAPLREIDGDIGFDPEEIVRLALELSDEEGRA